MGSLSDDIILQQLKEGSPQAFRVLYDQYYQPLCLQADLLLQDPAQAEDIVQQVFIQFWQQRRIEQIQTSLLGYLRTMVRNACFTFIRARDKDKQNRSDYGRFVPDIDDRELLEIQELSREMQHAIEELPDQCRIIFWQACVEGKKYKEVAEQQGLSINTVKEQLRRAFRKLRERMKDKRFIL